MSETGRVLKPANENPWYVLMTLYGEQNGEEVDWVLHEKNRAAWNIVVGRMLPERLRDAMDANGAHMPARDTWHQRGAALRTLHKKVWVLRNEEKEHEYPGFLEIDRGLIIDLSNLNFQHRVVARGFAFSCELSFRYSEFGGTAHFESAIFAKNCDYASTQFLRNCCFDKAAFFGEADFRNANLKFLVSFRNCVFDKSAIFMSSIFCREANFSYADFRDEAVFSSTDFNSDVMFGFAKFSNAAIFHHTIIRSDAWFNSAVFHGSAWFQFSTFFKMTYFDSSVFEVDARFDDADFKGHVNFNSASFNGFVDFAETFFGSAQGARHVAFKDAQFKKPANFRGVRFRNSYPDFSGAVLHDKTTFTARKELWPIGLQSDPEQAKASCAVIRHNLGKQGLPEEEHFFFRREMGFAAQIGGWWQRLPYRVFGAVSDFGYSIQRPALWLFGLWLAVAMINHVVLQWEASRDGVDYHVVQAFGLSFANQFPVFGLQGRWFSTEFLRDLNPWLKALGGVQTVLSLPLLFFFALGLRTRFRMR